MLCIQCGKMTQFRNFSITIRVPSFPSGSAWFVLTIARGLGGGGGGGGVFPVVISDYYSLLPSVQPRLQQKPGGVRAF